MKDYRFTLLASQAAQEQVLAKAGFFRYFKEVTGASNPRITIRTNNGASFVMDPGDSVRLETDCTQFDVTNKDGISALDGILLHGSYTEDATSSNLQLGGSIATSESRASAAAAPAAHTTSGTINTAAQVYAAAAATRRVRIAALKSNTDTIYLGHSNAVTAALFAWSLDPGEKLVLDLEAALALYSTCPTASQGLIYTLYT